MSWVKFHSALTEKDKRGIPRAVRFVYLELCLMSRPTRGVIRLPRGMTDLDGVYDMLGGNKSEVREAIRTLSETPEGDDDEPMIRFVGGSGSRALVIPSWERWNSLDESAARRARAYRERSMITGKEASASRRTNASVTANERQRHAPREDQRREEEIREDPLCEVDPIPDTKRAREVDDEHTRAHPIDPDLVDPRSGVTREHIVALLQLHPLLQRLAGPEDIEHLRFTCFNRKLRFGPFRDAIYDWLAKRAPACKHMPSEQLLGDIGGFLARASQWGGKPQQNSDTVAEHAEMVTEYGKRWKRVHRRDRVPDKGDEDACGELLKAATSEAKDGVKPRDVVLHWFDQHLANQERSLVDKCHPLRFLPTMLSQYEVRRPKPKTTKTEPPPEAPRGPEDAATRAAREECIRTLGIKPPTRPRPPATAAAEGPSPDVGAPDPTRAQEGPFPCQELASSTCDPDRERRAGPDPPGGGQVPIGQVYDLMPRLRGAR